MAEQNYTVENTDDNIQTENTSEIKNPEYIKGDTNENNEQPNDDEYEYGDILYGDDDDEYEYTTCENDINNNGQYSQPPIGYDDDDDNDDENITGENTLDEEALNSFIAQLFDLKKKNVQKKRESRLIPSINRFLNYDIDEKGNNLTPQIVKNLLHVCDLIYHNKIEVKTHPSDLEVLEYILDKDTPQKDVKFTLVEDFRIHAHIRKAVKILESVVKNGGNNTTTRTPEEAGLIEAHGEAVKSVKTKSSVAGRDIINFLNKKDNYKKSIVPDVDNDDGAQGAAPPPTAANPTPVKPATVACSRRLITNFLASKNVKPQENGIRTNTGTNLPISYDDMITDLTHNFTRTQPNLTIANRDRVITLLKRINMPVSYIRNKEMKEQYKIALESEENTHTPLTTRTTTTPLRRPLTTTPTTSRIGRSRKYF
ncbi:Hypothetical predicted protein [Paramuricea clavata]|uniref:Uncharacterized protein n=1 Tax=Paramuricea clavata TaxID=317549 RepID=A0A6S7GTN6_PARCT|nr:Hypothetical predicted protein [Paramuricea clavata]